MKKDYLQPEVILLTLFENDMVRTSAEKDNMSAWSEDWTGLIGGNGK